MILKNSEIYHYYLKLKKVFDSETRFLPAKIIFKIEYNLKQLLLVAEVIESSIQKIQQEYSNEEGKIVGKNEKLANKELADLSNIKEDIDIKLIPLEELEGIDFTPEQMEALLFMIKEE